MYYCTVHVSKARISGSYGIHCQEVTTNIMSVGAWTVVIWVAVLMSCSAVCGESEFCVHAVASIITALQKHFHSGCASVVRTTKDNNAILCKPDGETPLPDLERWTFTIIKTHKSPLLSIKGAFTKEHAARSQQNRTTLRTAKSWWVKTAHISQHSKASNAVLVTSEPRVKWWEE
jgi:hypothetical protein